MGMLDLIEYLKKINDLKEGVSSYAYEEEYKLSNGDTKKWVIIAVNDYDLYTQSLDFSDIINEARARCQDTLFAVYRPLNDKVKKQLKDKIIML